MGKEVNFPASISQERRKAVHKQLANGAKFSEWTQEWVRQGIGRWDIKIWLEGP